VNNKELLENHERYLEKLNLYKEYGYDIERERNFILEQAKPISGKILEAGAGKGHFSQVLAQQGYSFVAFDLSPEELHFAELNLAYYGLEKFVQFQIENAEHTSFADKSFDVIFSVNTIHHLSNPYKVIDELVRLLRPNGKLVLADFTEEGFRIIRQLHERDGKTHEEGQVTLAEVEVYLAKKDFSIKKAQGVCQQVVLAGKAQA